MSPPWTRPPSSQSYSSASNQSSPTSRSSQRSLDPFSCRNCLQTHAPIPGKYTTDCIMISVRTRLSPTDLELAAERLAASAYTTVRISETPEERHTQMECIWALFQDIVAEATATRREAREGMRHQSMSTDGNSRGRGARGSIRESAPLVWLRWIACDGRRGQTRSKANWEGIWERLVAGRDGLVAGWLTLSPLHATTED